MNFLRTATPTVRMVKQLSAPTLPLPTLPNYPQHPLVAGIEDGEVQHLLVKMPHCTLGTDFTPGVQGFRHIPEPATREGEIPPLPLHQLWPGILFAIHPARGPICLAQQHIPAGSLVGAATRELLSQEQLLLRLNSLEPQVRLHALQVDGTTQPKILDMTHGGNASRFISASDQPNVSISDFSGRGWSEVRASEDIRPGQEICAPAYCKSG